MESFKEKFNNLPWRWKLPVTLTLCYIGVWTGGFLTAEISGDFGLNFFSTPIIGYGRTPVFFSEFFSLDSYLSIFSIGTIRGLVIFLASLALVFYRVILFGIGFIFDKKEILKNNSRNFILTVLAFLVYGFAVGYLIS